MDGLVDEFIDRYPEMELQTPEEAIFVDDGPVDYLTWIALEDYDTHLFFYHDEARDEQISR